MVSFSNTGTESYDGGCPDCSSVHGREKLLKFEGHYHGHHDYVLFSVESPSVVAGLEQSPSKLPFYPGIPEEIAKTVVIAKWNDTTALEKVVKRTQRTLQQSSWNQFSEAPA